MKPILSAFLFLVCAAAYAQLNNQAICTPTHDSVVQAVYYVKGGGQCSGDFHTNLKCVQPPRGNTSCYWCVQGTLKVCNANTGWAWIVQSNVVPACTDYSLSCGGSELLDTNPNFGFIPGNTACSWTVTLYPDACEEESDGQTFTAGFNT
jgi:hypothetical protein